MMENNSILLLTLTGFSFQYEWLRTDNRRALFIGSSALGLNLLTRLTTDWTLSRRESSSCWCSGLAVGRGRPALHVKPAL